MNPQIKYHIYIPCLSVLFLLAGMALPRANAQEAQISLELELSPSVTNSQSVNLNGIVAKNGQGRNLFSLYIQNEDMNSAAVNLYLNFTLSSEKQGLIAEVYQQQGRPFSLDPGQQVYGTNNTLQRGLPGVEEDIDFDGGLTQEGQDFVNGLEGSFKLPPDTYTATVSLYQGANKRNGGVLVATSQQEFGGEIVTDDRDIFLTSPGDALGSEAEITNPYPEFRWEGNNGTEYRLIVVEARAQDSPESLIQGALSTEPMLDNGVAANGTLLDFEMLDITHRRTSYQTPPAGVQRLQPGELYYWQVFAEIRGSGGSTERRSSDIWSFRLTEQGDATVLGGGELSRTLRVLLGNEQYMELKKRGYDLQSIVIDGQTITGPDALQRLVELKDKLENGEISITFE